MTAAELFPITTANWRALKKSWATLWAIYFLNAALKADAAYVINTVRDGLRDAGLS